MSFCTDIVEDMACSHISCFICFFYTPSSITFIPSWFYLAPQRWLVSNELLFIYFEVQMGFLDNYFSGVNDYLSEQIPSPILTKEDWRSSICLALFFPVLCCWVAFPICEESHSVQYTACPGTTARHSDKSQHRETELYLHSASIHFWSRRFEIEFFPLPALPFSSVWGYDLRALRYLPCLFFFRAHLIQPETVKAQWIFCIHK